MVKAHEIIRTKKLCKKCLSGTIATLNIDLSALFEALDLTALKGALKYRPVISSQSCRLC